MTTVPTARRPDVVPAAPASKDRTVLWLAAAASLASLAAFLWYLQQDVILLYWDAISHLSISRRFFLSPTVGFGQLGYVWLPLPHLLTAPLVTIDALYFSGVAGSLVSMAAFVATAVLMYLTAYHLAAPKLPAAAKPAGIVAAVVFIANPNALYMQSTPMTELLSFVFIAGTVYGIQRWVQISSNDRQLADRYLLAGSIAGGAASLTRYEAWGVVFLMTAVVWYVARRRKVQQYTEAMVAVVALVAYPLGWLFWMLWNLVIFNDPLGWLNGRYAKSSLWVSATDPAIGHPMVALKTYFYAMTDNLTWLVMVVAVAGLLFMVIRERCGEQLLPLMTTVALFPAFWLLITTGQRPLYVIQVNGSLYNVRFGLLMLLPAAITAGYLGGYLAAQLRPEARKLATALCCLVPLTAATFAYATEHGVVTLYEPSGISTIEPVKLSKEASVFMAANYQGGRILMMSFGNEFVLPQAGIGTDDNVYEGSFRQWEPALQDPTKQNIAWVVMRKPGQNSQVDDVYASLHDSDVIARSYQLRFENNSYLVYGRRTA